MKYQFIFASNSEKRALEVDMIDAPLNVGDYVQLPFGENNEIRRYRTADISYTPVSQEKTIFYIEVEPA
jgi:hypothetical protein